MGNKKKTGNKGKYKDKKKGFDEGNVKAEYENKPFDKIWRPYKMRKRKKSCESNQ